MGIHALQQMRPGPREHRPLTAQPAPNGQPRGINPATLDALEHARKQHVERQMLHVCASCVNLWPDGTCRVGDRSIKDGIAIWPKVDGLGCGLWDPIAAPGKSRYSSAPTEADRAFFFGPSGDEGRVINEEGQS